MSDVKQFFGITFGAGDFIGLFSLFFDNLSTLLGLSFAILGLSSTSTILPDIVFKRIVPAAGIMLFLGNCYYTHQAIRMRKKYNRPYTAQPYGLNTAGGFPFVFGIIYGVYYAYSPVCTEAGCPADSGFTDGLAEENYRVELAWKVCVSANFLTGLINIFLGFFGQLLLKAFPVAAMLVPLAGIGFTWLALNQIAPNFETPAIGLIPVYLIFTQYYGLGRFHICKGWYIPEALPVAIFGIVAGKWTRADCEIIKILCSPFSSIFYFDSFTIFHQAGRMASRAELPLPLPPGHGLVVHSMKDSVTLVPTLASSFPFRSLHPLLT